MTAIHYKDRSAHELRLRLYGGFPDWPDAAVLSNGRAVRGDLEIWASVIGSSHMMQIRAGALSLTELLACEAPPAGRLLALWQPGDSALDYIAGKGIRYRFEARVLDLERSAVELAQLRGLTKRAERFRAQLGLTYRFPASVRVAGAPETLVWAAAEPRGVIARTAHSYPSEGLVVFSATTVRVAASARDRAEHGVLAGV